jgi:hypothetical protein
MKKFIINDEGCKNLGLFQAQSKDYWWAGLNGFMGPFTAIQST